MMKFNSGKLLEVADKITENRYVKIIVNSFIGINALTIGGAIFTLIRSIPLGEWYTNFLTSTGLMEMLNFPILITSNLVALFLIFSVGYNTAKEFDKNPLSGGLIASGAFLMLIPLQDSSDFGSVLTASSFGAQGMFLALIAGILAARIYVYCMDHNLKLKMPDSVPGNVTAMFETMIPAGVVFLVFMLVRYGFQTTSFGTAQNFIYTLLQAPLAKVAGGLPGYSVFMFVTCFLWVFGIHGGMVAYAGMAPVYTAMMIENAAAFASGVPCPHPEYTMLCFINLGGTGATLALNLLMVARAKSARLKSLGKIALPTSIFNITEPLVFGAPIVMNPYLAIPFIICPQINLFLGYFAYTVGPFAPPTGASITSYIPVGLQAAFATSSWTGVVLVAILLAINLAVYYPFFKAYDNKLVKEEGIA